MSQINAGKFIASTGVEFPSYTNNNKPTNLGRIRDLEWTRMDGYWRWI